MMKTEETWKKLCDIFPIIHIPVDTYLALYHWRWE